MPCHYEIFDEFNLVKITFDGVLITPEMLALIDQLDADPRYHPTIDELGDFRTLKDIAFDSKTLKNLNDLILGLYLRSDRRKRIAQIAPKNPGRTIAVAFRFAMQGNPKLDAEVFETQADALAFLDHPADLELASKKLPASG